MFSAEDNLDLDHFKRSWLISWFISDPSGQLYLFGSGNPHLSITGRKCSACQWQRTGGRGHLFGLLRLKLFTLFEEYKYLGVYFNNKLDWTRDAEAVYKKRPKPTLFPQEAVVL